MKAIRKFQLSKRTTDYENVVSLSGELDLSAATCLTAELDPLVKEAERTLTLDLKDMTYIDSTGIGIFVSVLKARAAMNADFRLINTPAPIRRIFDMTGVSRFFAGSPQ